jgi:hypothetical protein
MRKSLLAAAAITAAMAAVLAIGPLGRTAAAMPAASPSQFGPAGGAAVAAQAVVVCGPGGCYWRPGIWGWHRPYPYWPWRRHYWWGAPQYWRPGNWGW